MASTIGIDVGGTKIAMGVVDTNGAVSLFRRHPTPPRAGSKRLLDAIADHALQLASESAADISQLGIGIGGTIRPDDGKVLSATDILGDWVGTAVKAELERRTGLSVSVDNDVKVFAIGEHRFGAGVGAENALYVTVGTGIGGAVFLNGRLLRGATWSACELGHVPVMGAEGRACPCGKTGHVEAVSSGPAMSRRHQQINGGELLPLEQIATLAREGDAVADQILREGGRCLGIALAGIANTIDPEVIVLGGGVIGVGGNYLESVRSAYDEYALPGPSRCPIMMSQLGAEAAVIGAASIAMKPVISI
ncbi:ROK family protein [Paramicrobacterium sp. CJ85]|uniref:ROK family protein n=1 Tax=Paramicrobacterium sp. CJ85 TaxID=3445355 RepID=UPI003F61EB82